MLLSSCDKKEAHVPKINQQHIFLPHAAACPDLKNAKIKINLIENSWAESVKSSKNSKQKKELDPSYNFLVTNITNITCYKNPQNVSI